MKSSAGRRVNRSELAEILGVATTTIDTMVRRGLPYVQRATSRGKGWLFDTAEVRAWELQRAVENAIGDSATVDKEEADKRKAIAQAALAEFELAQKRRELISVDLAAEVVRRDYTAVRARLLGLPAKLAPELALAKQPSEARVILEVELREVLSELSGGFGAESGDTEPVREEGPGGTVREPSPGTEDDDLGMGGRESLPLAGGIRRSRKVENQPS